jgi:ribosomal RNA-processing protein 8
LWHTYHAISESNESSFPESEIPRNRIIECLNKIQTKRTKTVVDLGCGRADIARHFKDDSRFSFINYDHVSTAQNVDVCDISQIPLEDASAEIVVLCLAMWGSNCREYVKEAFRVLETRGWLYMIEPTKRWTDEDVENENKVAEPGNKLESLLQDAGFLVMEMQIQKFSMFVCVKQ